MKLEEFRDIVYFKCAAVAVVLLDDKSRWTPAYPAAPATSITISARLLAASR